ncbi:MAG: thiamine pyrophosphate-binding protein [Desulfobacterales bacterium]|nr:thiamine pyrophosphate-binding protein [Desulfobacterales bacterium]
MNTSELIVQILEENGVKYIFGIPGAPIEDLNTSLHASGKIKPIVTKHEEGAAFMADGYARLSNKLGACFSTSGPGATNLVTALCTSYRDYIPIIALTGQVSTSVLGKGAVQESGVEGIDLVGTFANFTKHSYMLLNEQRAQYIVGNIVRLALSSPGGPVHLNLPADVMKKTVPVLKRSVAAIEGRVFDRDGVKATAKALVGAKRPVIVAGWGTVLSRGADMLLELAELLNIPVATTPKAKGVFPETHRLSLGVLGFAGNGGAIEYVFEKDVDVMLAIGTGFDDMTTCGWDERLNPTEHLIQIDSNAGNIGKNYSATIGVVGDARAVLLELGYAVRREFNFDKTGGNLEWVKKRSGAITKEMTEIKANVPPEEIQTKGDGSLYSPSALVKDVQRIFPSDAIFFSEIGAIMAWSIRHLVMDEPYSFHLSLGYGAMGYGTAAPIGAKLAMPDRPVISLAGDGAFLMNGMDVSTAVNYNIPVVWVVFNNQMFGLIYHGRQMGAKVIPEGIPSRFESRTDFVKLAEGYGARGIRIEKPEDMTPELAQDIIDAGRPTVLDVWIDEEEVPPIGSRIGSIDKHYAK